MAPSSAFCRAREDHHLRRAADTRLDNVRIIAGHAAAAWARKAAFAELREQRGLPAPSFGGAAVAADRQSIGDDLSVSENPDRGRATTP